MRRRLRRVKGGPREEQLDESSESESVSGGDDEQVATVVVPDRVRQNIKFEEESSLSEPPDPEQGDGQGGGHDEVDEKEESLIATGGAADEGSGVSVGRAEGAMSSCGVSRGGEELQADTLTETAHTKSIAALSKLRKLKEAKVSVSTVCDQRGFALMIAWRVSEGMCGDCRGRPLGGHDIPVGALTHRRQAQ